MTKRIAKIESGVLIGIVLTVAIVAAGVAFIIFGTSGTSSKLGPEFEYDVKKLAHISADLIRWQPVGQEIQTGFQQSRAVAVNADGAVYIAGDEMVEIYDKNSPVVKRFELGAKPTCLGFDLNGDLVVGLTDHLGFMDDYGNVTAEWKKPADNAILTSVAVDKDNVYAADAVNKVVWRFDRQGNVAGQLGKKDPGRNIPGLVIPSPYFDIAMAADGLLRVVNPGRHLIAAYTPEGDREWTWGKTTVAIEGFSGCCNPVAIAILSDGRFVTAEKGLIRVKIYDADGSFQAVVAGPEQLSWQGPLQVCGSPEECRSMSLDVAVDSHDRIYVLDTTRNVVKVFEEL